MLSMLDRQEHNNNRRHREHRDGMDLTMIERQREQREFCSSSKTLKLIHAEDWVEIIFSKKAEDLHQLVRNHRVAAALQSLTPIQKQVLFWNIVQGMPTSEIAARMGCSVRNVTKHRQRALEKVRRLADKKTPGRIETPAEI
ncbi:MAG: sigma-70 family RNA polymerase sigma factor [Clostridia bacterium]|nr:sigma-70 family RNA polymerase sigma factor [Clostridia bacterium]